MIYKRISDNATPRSAGVLPANAAGTAALLGWHSRGYLPHFDGGSIPQSVMIRLSGSLPKDLLDQWENELATLSEAKANQARRRRIEEYLDRGIGVTWLREPVIARLVEQSLLHFDGERYELHAWVVMPNHVHLLFTPCHGQRLASILHSWKSFTAHEANRILRRRGKFWQEEYFDRYIRNEKHFEAAVSYIEMNPVNARLCKRPEEWPFGSAKLRCLGAQASRLQTKLRPGRPRSHAGPGKKRVDQVRHEKH